MATVTLTPSRADLLPGPSFTTKLAGHHTVLQPSAMPPPPPTSASKMSTSRNLENPFLVKRPEVFTSRDRRPALGDLSTNRSPFNTSIPKPALVPDVFSQTHTSHKRPAAADHEGGGRKRRALDDVRVQDQRAAKESEQEKWRNKWMKSFPTLIFHFDVGAQEGSGRLLKARTTKMGAKVEQFFSTKVTHLIVKNVTSPSKPKSAQTKGSPKNPFYDPSGGGSLAQKAEALGMKVWTLKKLTDILDRVAPLGQTNAQSNSLSTLLEDEKLHGTRERDATAPRPDWYYFRPGSKYLLVEDALAKHRTVLVKEYQPQPPKTEPEYPVLYESFLKLTTSSESHVPLDLLRDRAYTLYVDQHAWHGEAPPRSLNRSTSLLSIPGTPSVPDIQPYHHASGNSVVITSNIASTSTANHSPAFVNGVPALGAGRGPIMQMSKRVQVLKGNAAKRGSSTSSPAFERPAPVHSSSSSSSTSSSSPALGRKTFMTQDQVIAMLRKQRAPVEPDPSITVEKRIRNREKVDSGFRGVKEQDTAAGYCENCRLRYEDLSVHLSSRKHRRFATDPQNFADLDSLLKLLQRQINPNFAHDDVPFAPCWDDHTKDHPCERCDCMVGLPESEGHESSLSGIEEWAQPGDDNDDDEGDTPTPTSSQQSVDAVADEEVPGFFEESAEGKEFDA